MNEPLKSVVQVGALAILVVTTAIACVYARHESRKQFTRLQVLISDRDVLDVEWGQLQIERSTFSQHSMVEQIARKKMSMRTPSAEEIKVVRQ
jgi:cell division protein FtsL